MVPLLMTVTSDEDAPEPPAAVFADDRRRRVAGALGILIAALLARLGG